jgi:hypothetical protein
VAPIPLQANPTFGGSVMQVVESRSSSPGAKCAVGKPASTTVADPTGS